MTRMNYSVLETGNILSHPRKYSEVIAVMLLKSVLRFERDGTNNRNKRSVRKNRGILNRYTVAHDFTSVARQLKESR